MNINKAVMNINKALVRKVLKIIDAGLVSGMGEPEPGRMCVEAAVNYAMGAPHGDQPACVSPALRQLKISLNDKGWSTPAARAKGLRRLAIAQLGSAGVLDEKEFLLRVTRLAIQTCVPQALRAAARSFKGDKKDKLLNAADLCERDPTIENARAARSAAYADADADADAADAAYADAAAAAAAYAAAAYADADADADAADAAYADAAAAAAAYAAAADAADAAAAAYAAAADADAADDVYAAYAAYAAAAAAADAAAAAAAAAAYADAAAAAAAYARDTSLAAFAEGVVQILIDMKAPGCEWLDLTTEAAT